MPPTAALRRALAIATAALLLASASIVAASPEEPLPKPGEPCVASSPCDPGAPAGPDLDDGDDPPGPDPHAPAELPEPAPTVSAPPSGGRDVLVPVAAVPGVAVADPGFGRSPPRRRSVS